ncbi:hypothetical protein L2E82_07613, partial [Cichorium intybus]
WRFHHHSQPNHHRHHQMSVLWNVGYVALILLSSLTFPPRNSTIRFFLVQLTPFVQFAFRNSFQKTCYVFCPFVDIFFIRDVLTYGFSSIPRVPFVESRCLSFLRD